jgi:hypothetical protein
MRIEVSYAMPNGRIIYKRFSGVKGVLEDRGLAVSKLEVHFHSGKTAEVFMLPGNLSWEQWGIQVKVLQVRDRK